jgi:hypothetical protein
MLAVLLALLLTLIFLSHLKIFLLHKRIGALYEIIQEQDRIVETTEPEKVVTFSVDSEIVQKYDLLTDSERLHVFTILLQFDGLLKDEIFADTWRSFHASSALERTKSFRLVLQQLDSPRSKLLQSAILQVLLKRDTGKESKQDTTIESGSLKPAETASLPQVVATEVAISTEVKASSEIVVDEPKDDNDLKIKFEKIAEQVKDLKIKKSKKKRDLAV